MAYYTRDEEDFENLFRTEAFTVGYTDNSGIEHESYEAACAYYGAETPAQLAAEDAYWAEEEANAELDARFNDAIVYSRATARWALNVASFDPDLVDDCPF